MSQSPRKATKITFNANCSNTVSLEINQNMSTELDTIKIVEACIQHAIKYSLTHVHSSVHYCYSRVIPLASIQSMISKDFAVEAYEIVKLYTTLQTFFEQIYNEFDDKTKEQLKWIFKVMNYDEYQNDSRVFPPLKDVVYHYCPNGIQKLFVVYRVDDVDKLRDVLRDTIYESVLHNASNILTKEDIQNIEEDAHAYKQSEDQIKEYRDHIEEGEYQVNEGECHVEQNQDRVEKNNDHAEKNKDDIEQNQDSGKEYKKIEQEALEANDSQKTKADENEEDKKIGKEAFKVNDHQKTEPVYLDEYSFLTEELEVLNQVLSISKQSYAARASIIDRINYMLRNLWGLEGLYVTAFGSTMNGLGTNKTDLDLCVVIPYLNQKSDYEKRMLKLLPNSVFNMNSMATHLSQIGMVNLEAINSAIVPICKFTDPFTGLHCDINTNSILGIENTQLIIQYMNLDVRIRPFLFALKFFVQQKSIMDTRRGTLSSYTYLVMGLHYLMYVQNPPVIPSLHNLKGAECKSPACRSKSNRIIDGWSVNYHDCIVIENTINEKLPITDDLDENSTLWPSTNAESVGELFIGFCKHLSTKQNLFSKVSITEPSNEMKDLEEWKGRKCVVQDPFNLKKNLAYSVTEIGGTVICKEFEHAFSMLKEGKCSFRQVIESEDTVERPLDPDSLDYKYGTKGFRHLGEKIVRKEEIHC